MIKMKYIFCFAFLAFSERAVSGVVQPKAVTTPSPECIRRCRSCPPTPVCAPGVSLVPDECGCCKMCSRQVGESCSERLKCDPHKNLYCSYNDVDEEGQRCVAMPGRSCFSGSKTYKNGETFNIGCKITCNCIDGYLACFPQCPSTLTATSTKNCLYPKLVKKPGKCCEEWVCTGDRLNNTTAVGRRTVQAPSRRIVQSQPIRHTPHRSLAAARRRSTITVRIRPKDKCKVQTTEWSPCSTTCGWGISDRVITDKSCKLQKQTRLCQIRPCINDFAPKKRGKRCTKTVKAPHKVRFSFSTLRSKVYTPKYCGTCRDGRCCTPKKTTTKTITFRSDNGKQVVRKKMMMIKSCQCKRQCSESANDIFIPFRQMNGDTWRQ